MKSWMIALCLAVIAVQGWYTFKDRSATEAQLRSMDRALDELRAAPAPAPGDPVRETRVEIRERIVEKAAPAAALAEQVGPSDEAEKEKPAPPPLEQKVEQTYVAEEIDELWAENASRKIVEGSLPLLTGGSSLGDVDCRATMCRVEFRHTTPGAHQRFVEAAVFDGRFWMGPGTYSRVTDENGQEVTLAFFGREDADQTLWQ